MPLPPGYQLDTPATPPAGYTLDPASNGGKSATQPETPSVTGWLGNLVSSTGKLIGNTASAIAHPIDTVSTLGDIVGGGIQDATGLDLNQGSPDSVAKFHAVVDNLKQRYGSLDNIKHTLYEDPAGAAMDLSTIFDGVGGGLRVVGKAGELADLTRAAALANRGADVAKNAAQLTNPLTQTARAVGATVQGAGTAVDAAKSLIPAKSPTLANFAEAFGKATPTQKATISEALPTLIADGIVPPDDLLSMRDAVQGRIADIENEYKNLDPAIRQRKLPAQRVIGQLQNEQMHFTQKGAIIDQDGFDALQNQIDKVNEIAQTNGGHLDLDDLLKMKQTANGRTTFQTPPAEKGMWQRIGDVYRAAADHLAPETTPLNNDYRRYNGLQRIALENIAQGKGGPSGIDHLITKGAQHGMGVSAGAALGGAAFGPIGAAAGGVVGGIIGPKVGKYAAQALQNVIDSGAFQKLPPVKQNMLRTAAQMGDSSAVLKMLGMPAREEGAEDTGSPQGR